MDFKFYWYISSTWKDGVLRPRCSMLNVDEALNIVNFLIEKNTLNVDRTFIFFTKPNVCFWLG